MQDAAYITLSLNRGSSAVETKFAIMHVTEMKTDMDRMAGALQSEQYTVCGDFRRLATKT
jgi:hypothetical protein